MAGENKDLDQLDRGDEVKSPLDAAGKAVGSKPDPKGSKTP